MSGAGPGLALVWRLGAATTLVVSGFAMIGPVLAVLLQQAGHGTAFITGYTWGGTLGPVASGSALQGGGTPGLALGALGAARRAAPA